MIKSNIKILLLFIPMIVMSSCAVFNKAQSPDHIYVYEQKDVILVLSPSDSVKMFIYKFAFSNSESIDSDICTSYADSTLLSLFTSGNIFREILGSDNSSMEEWSEIQVCPSKIIIKEVDNVFDVEHVATHTDIELVQFRNISPNQQNEVFSFQITFNYGTVHYCYEIKRLNRTTFALRFTGMII